MKLESKFGILTMKHIDKPLQSESTSSFAICHRAHSKTGHHKPILFAPDADAAASLSLAVDHELKNISSSREREKREGFSYTIRIVHTGMTMVQGALNAHNMHISMQYIINDLRC